MCIYPIRRCIVSMKLLLFGSEKLISQLVRSYILLLRDICFAVVSDCRQDVDINVLIHDMLELDFVWWDPKVHMPSLLAFCSGAVQSISNCPNQVPPKSKRPHHTYPVPYTLPNRPSSLSDLSHTSICLLSGSQGISEPPMVSKYNNSEDCELFVFLFLFLFLGYWCLVLEHSNLSLL